MVILWCVNIRAISASRLVLYCSMCYKIIIACRILLSLLVSHFMIELLHAVNLSAHGPREYSR